MQMDTSILFYLFIYFWYDWSPYLIYQFENEN
jgi:hypothetical protein